MNRLFNTLVPLLLAGGCAGETTTEPPILPIRNMHDQQRYDPQEEKVFFRDGRSMREPVPGTIPREMSPELTLSVGRLNDDSSYVTAIPQAIYDEIGGGQTMVQRGQARYAIYCKPCHDGLGMGQGTAVQRGMAQPPSLHEARLRRMPDGQLFATISNGVRNMPPYKHSIPVADRWAIVSYVRALQLSQARAGE